MLIRKYAPLLALSALFTALALATPPAPTTQPPATAPATQARSPLVGFAQVGSESSWRNFNTLSVKTEAKKRGYELISVDANSKIDDQRQAVADFIDQRVDLIILEPLVDFGWDALLTNAKSASIPVLIADRNVSAPNDFYTAFLGSDFRDEGRKAGEWLAKKTGGKAVIAELQGQLGSSAARDRKIGFEEAIAKYPNMKIVLSKAADFRRAEGREVTAAFLQNPAFNEVTALYAHNDDMALGAIAALEQAGKKPGKDLLLISVDGTMDAIKALRDGKINCVVECNPSFGPQLFDIADQILKGRKVDKEHKTIEAVYDQEGLDFGRPEKAVNINKSDVKGF